MAPLIFYYTPTAIDKAAGSDSGGTTVNHQSRSSSKGNTILFRRNLRLAEGTWGHALSPVAKRALHAYSEQLRMSIDTGDLLLIDGKWYVTHSGLLHLATRRRCRDIEVSVVPQLCDPSSSRWAFRATVYKSTTCKGFVGHGDADPSNVSALVRGAAWPKPARSTGPCARLTGLESARSKRSTTPRSPMRPFSYTSSRPSSSVS